MLRTTNTVLSESPLLCRVLALSHRVINSSLQIKFAGVQTASKPRQFHTLTRCSSISNTKSQIITRAKDKKGGKGNKGRDRDEEEQEEVEIDFSDMESKMESTIEHLKKEFAVLRTGRASPDLLERIIVKIQGNSTPLIKLSQISVKDPHTLLVNLYDDSVGVLVEEAIRDAGLGVFPSRSGGVITVSLPKPTAEYRQTLAKQASKEAEAAKGSIRRHRKDFGMDLIKKAKLTTDDEKRKEKEVQTITDKYNFLVDSLLAQKTKDISKLG
eukprot:TRINITY_DN6105_c0_g2_i3.p1 TRINITY_DN6105_c0_g2~~TRINITY_DN6105_c0_g2_i3.p1  ORF type:complete len:270 (+),score=52.31 TRINITY_DN6105_c0_g2_i3:43-852(+)